VFFVAACKRVGVDAEQLSTWARSESVARRWILTTCVATGHSITRQRRCAQRLVHDDSDLVAMCARASVWAVRVAPCERAHSSVGRDGKLRVPAQEQGPPALL